MVARYENYADANQQLGGTIAMFDGRPIKILECYPSASDPNDIMAHICFLPRARDRMSISIFDDRFDAKGMGRRLGYVNTFGTAGAVYCSRIPSRQYKQGISKNNLSINPKNGIRVTNYENIITMGGFHDCLINVYPSLAASKERLMQDNTIESIAFHKDFALQHDELGFFVLLYKNERIAWGDINNLKLSSDFKYLKEVIELAGVKL